VIICGNPKNEHRLHLEKRVNEGGNYRVLCGYQQNAEQEHDENDWEKPEFFALHEKFDEFLDKFHLSPS
jgi:hypothetical protein